jgi:hypothetical protein
MRADAVLTQAKRAEAGVPHARSGSSGGVSDKKEGEGDGVHTK